MKIIADLQITNKAVNVTIFDFKMVKISVTGKTLVTPWYIKTRTRIATAFRWVFFFFCGGGGGRGIKKKLRNIKSGISKWYRMLSNSLPSGPEFYRPFRGNLSKISCGKGKVFLSAFFSVVSTVFCLFTFSCHELSLTCRLQTLSVQTCQYFCLARMNKRK